MEPAIRVKLDLPVHTEQAAEWWLARCPTLGVISQGTSEKEAVRNLREEIVFLLHAAAERDALVPMLRRRLAVRVETPTVDRWIRVGLPPEVIAGLGDEAISLPQS